MLHDEAARIFTQPSGRRRESSNCHRSRNHGYIPHISRAETLRLSRISPRRTMKPLLRAFLPFSFWITAIFINGCASSGPQGIQQARIDTSAAIAAEAPGNYYIGRRYYKPEFRFWGYVRRPGQPWSTAQLVMMNERQKLVPDRQQGKFGIDNNYEYKLYGEFSGDKVYEPASNGIYPEFILRNYELISTNPPPIFKSQLGGRAQAAVGRLQIERPQ